MLRIKNLKIAYNDGREFSYPDLTTCPGKVLLIKGKNGSGKSTILNYMFCTIPINCITGNITFNRIAINSNCPELYRYDFRYIPQDRPEAGNFKTGSLLKIIGGKDIVDFINELYKEYDIPLKPYDHLKSVKFKLLSFGEWKSMLLYSYLSIKALNGLCIDELLAGLSKNLQRINLKILDNETRKRNLHVILTVVEKESRLELNNFIKNTQAVIIKI